MQGRAIPVNDRGDNTKVIELRESRYLDSSKFNWKWKKKGGRQAKDNLLLLRINIARVRVSFASHTHMKKKMYTHTHTDWGRKLTLLITDPAESSGVLKLEGLLILEAVHDGSHDWQAGPTDATNIPQLLAVGSNFHVTKHNGHRSPGMRSEGGAVPTARSTGGSN